MDTNARPDRREVMKWMLAASSSGILPAPKVSVNTPIVHGAAFRANLESVRNRIQQAMASGNATGVAVAVVVDGRILWEEGFGWANRETGLKATPHTPFSLASITKPFTTTTIMTLVAEGKLSLSERANKYLVSSKIIGTNGRADAAIVRLLGAHASGLPGMYESYDTGEARLRPDPNALMQAYGRLAYPPATRYEYSNIGYAALHAIASTLTQTEFGTLMQQRVLEPLGLHDSFFGSNSVRVPSSATRYDPLRRPIAHYITSTPASGELYASAHDLAQFILFNMHHRVKGQASILSERQIDELHRPVFTGPSGVASTFGWFTSHTPSGVPFIFKTGGDPGVANRICFVPSEGLACVVLTNQSNASELAYSVCDELMAKYLPGWRRPEEDCGFPGTAFSAASPFRGRWQGWLENDGVKLPVKLNISSHKIATLTIGNDPAENITGMRMEGDAFTGTSTGRINSPDVMRTGAKTLQIKLAPSDNRLVGRVFATVGDLNFKNARVPFVLTLMRG